MSELTYVTEATFEQEVLQAQLPVLLEFTAVWCGPCKMLEPVLQEIAVEYAGQMKVVKVDADKNPALVTRFGVMGIPTLMLFKGGASQVRLTGFLPKPRLLAKITPHL